MLHSDPSDRGERKNISPIPSHGMASTGIRARLFFLLLVMLVPTFAIQAVIFYDRYHDRKAEEFQSNLEIARAMANAFEAFVQTVHQQEHAIAIALSISPLISSEDAGRILREGIEGYAPLQDMSWVGRNGRILSSSDPGLVGADISQSSYFRQLAAGSEWIVSDLQLSDQGKAFFIIARAPNLGAKGFRGAVLATVVPDRLDEVLAIKRPRQGSVSLVDSSGRLVYRYPHVGITWEDRDFSKFYPSLRSALRGKEVKGVVTLPYEENKRMAAVTPIRSIGWVAGAGRSEEEAMGPMISGLLRDGILFLFVGLSSFLASLFLARSISRPIKKLQEQAVVFGQDKKDTWSEVNGPSEVQDLARTFHEMTEHIRLWTSRAEQRAADAEEGNKTLEALMEHVPEGIAIVDLPSFRIRKISRFGKETARNPQETYEGNLLGKYLKDILLYESDGVTPLSRDEVPLLAALQRGEVVANVEYVLRDPRSAQTQVFLCNAGPILDDEGRVVGGVITWRDITERKRMEVELRSSRDDLERRVRERTAELIRSNEALKGEIQMRMRTEAKLEINAHRLEQSNRELEDFIFAASHDLQEPLRKIQTFGNMVFLKCADSLSREGIFYITRMCKAAERMQHLIRSLLDYSHATSKSSPFERVSLSEAAAKAISNLEDRVKEAKASIEICDLPQVEAVGAQMVQVFQNLLSNALKFRRETEPVRVRVYSRRVENGDSGRYEICVEDNGIGFEEKYKERIFTPFQALNKRDEYKGVGMGLAICKKIVEHHHGTISAKSIPGKGTTLIVTLPAKQNPEST